MIKAVIFDVGRVIVKSVLRDMAKELAEKHSMDFNIINKEIHKRWDDYKIGKISADEFWGPFIEESKISESAAELKRIALGHIKPVPGTLDIAKSLKGRYRLAVISNNADEWVEKEKKIIDFGGIFDVLVFSNEVGIAKPGKEIFMLCLEKLGGLKPGECVFIDDQENNIVAAQKLGFRTIKFEDAEQLKSELKKLGVEV